MTEPDIQAAVELFKEFRAQQQPNMSAGSREALLRHTIEELLDTVPRLRDTTNADEIRQTLDQLATQIQRSAESGSTQK
jgi:type VI protein secretion system component VasF